MFRISNLPEELLLEVLRSAASVFTVRHLRLSGLEWDARALLRGDVDSLRSYLNLRHVCVRCAAPQRRTAA